MNIVQNSITSLLGYLLLILLSTYLENYLIKNDKCQCFLQSGFTPLCQRVFGIMLAVTWPL
jgi:hypothetical protein